MSETRARRLARRYLLSQLPLEERAKRSQITVAEFIETRFLPDLIAGKLFQWRSHYHSIFRHILSPEDVHRLLGASGDSLNAKPIRQPDWPYLGHLRLRDVRSSHVHRLIRTALERGYSPQTVRHIRSVVSAVFSYAKQELVFSGPNPARSARLPEFDQKDTPALTLEQMERALSAMRYPEKQLTFIAMHTDMNVSEICGLQWKCVNLTGAWLDLHGEVIPPITMRVRKKCYRGELADVKESRQRNIQIPENLLPMLLLQRARTAFTGPDDFVLTSRSGTALNVSNITARRLGSIGKQLGIQELTLQALRRAQGLIKPGLGMNFQHGNGVAFSPEHRIVRSASNASS